MLYPGGSYRVLFMEKKNEEIPPTDQWPDLYYETINTIEEPNIFHPVETKAKTRPVEPPCGRLWHDGCLRN